MNMFIIVNNVFTTIFTLSFFVYSGETSFKSSRIRHIRQVSFRKVHYRLKVWGKPSISLENTLKLNMFGYFNIKDKVSVTRVYLFFIGQFNFSFPYDQKVRIWIRLSTINFAKLWIFYMQNIISCLYH